MCGGLDVGLGEDDGGRGGVLPVGGALSCACCRDFVNRSMAAILVAGLDAVVGDRLARGCSAWEQPQMHDTHRISAIRSSMAYHAIELNATPRHQPNWSAGSTYACACRWSVTGIFVSLNGGVMNPIRKGWVLPGARSFRSRLAMLRRLTRRGRSLEDWCEVREGSGARRWAYEHVD